ncbi:MAG: glucans biosynthesis glucosyltransferase MdoH [Candidatus Sumerlaeia bacterium]|nr:glucans biosynthesis glucosyltransferase MdoH [Candidatus Sumerlaeia bacterium]
MAPETRSFFYVALVRYFIATVAGLATIWATTLFSQVVLWDRPSFRGLLLTALFTILFFWIVLNFLSVFFGFLRSMFTGLRAPDYFDRLGTDRPPDVSDLPRTAVVIPIYNEDVEEVFAGVYAMHDSMKKSGTTGLFDVFVMSDTTNPDVWIEEERAFLALRRRLGGSIRCHYRRRPKNVSRKAGNIEDFVVRWGARYEFMIVLDADSTMSALTMAEMVRRMASDPEVGILQVPPLPASRRSLFARVQQFASALYSGVFAAGFSLWTADAGNYFGHNAIIRTRAFAKHCKLPLLPGKPPLGGEILSHDFVEAALIQRGGYKVIVADDLPGSYEECPTSLLDFAVRDQRWCQGNLQHVRLAMRPGFGVFSRIHFLMGAMSYVASPLWLLFILAGLAFMGAPPPWKGAVDPGAPAFTEYHAAQSLFLFAVVMALLLLPKLFALAHMLRNPWMKAWFGGVRRASASVILETALSVLTAPVMMVFHTVFVVSTLLGRVVRWDAQNRGERPLPLGEALRAYRLHAGVGIGLTALSLMVSPGAALFLAPVSLSLVFAGFIAKALSSVRLGDSLRRGRLLMTRSELMTPHVLARKAAHLLRLRGEAAAEREVDPLVRAMMDPALNALHCSLLQLWDEETRPPRDAASRRLALMALCGGVARLSRAERVSILSDYRTMRWSHHVAWQERAELTPDVFRLIGGGTSLPVPGQEAAPAAPTSR